MTTGRLNPWLWLALPMLACVAAQIVFATPVRILGLQLPEPVFAMVPAFAWAAVGASLAAPFALLLLGVFLDLLWGAPLGLWPLSLLAVHGGAVLGRALVAGQGSAAQLAWYAGACGLGFLAAFVVTATRAGIAPNLISIFWQFLSTGALFPLAWGMTQRFDEADVRFR